MIDSTLLPSAKSDIRLLSTFLELPVIYNKNRSRAHNEPEEEIVSATKRAKKDLFNNLPLAIAALVESCYSKVDLAVELLETKYLKRLDNTDFAKALDVLTNEIKATVWLAIGKYSIKAQDQ